jgi:hypothetical protein
MRAPTMNVFKKNESAKPAVEHHPPSSKNTPPGVLFKSMPSWWMTLMAYALAAGFCYLIHQFFLWFPPYLREVFKNLRGLPVSWADIGLFWGERGLTWIALAAALYHNLWQVSTRYQLTSHDIHIETWFPFRRVVSAPYGSVRRVGYQQSPLGLIFNYGHIEIDTGSPSGLLVLLNCPRPKKFVSLLQSKVEPILQPHLAPHRRSTDPQ